MGDLTHAQIVTESLELAGNIGLTTRAQTWLGLILKDLSEHFTFPQQSSMVGTFTPTGNVLHPDGVGGDEAGAGCPGVSTLNGRNVRGIRRIILQETVAVSAGNPILETELDLLTEAGYRAGDNNTLGEQLTGKPRRALLTPYANGFYVRTLPYPDKTYTAVVYADVPWSSLSYSASVVNPYMNDMTVIQGVYAYALRHMVDERASEAWAEYIRQRGEDRVRYGNMNPDNKTLKLASTSFRPRGATNSKPWDWMGRK